jgi:hypothetical protein
MIGGFVLGGQGEKALTEARRYKAEVSAEVAKLDTFEDFLEQAQQRITEMRGLLESFNSKAIDHLIQFESEPFDRERDTARFQQVALIIQALVEIMKTPVLDAEGNLNLDAAELKAKYRTI